MGKKNKLTKFESEIEKEMIKQKNLMSVELFNKLFIQLNIAEIIQLEEYINDINNPIWKPIVINGKSTIYEISNVGTIRNTTTGVIRKSTKVWSGYSKINFYMENKCYTVMIHRLVAEAFVPNPYNRPVVNHKNGIKTINWWKNLEWTTHQENTQHAIDIGLSLREGINNPNNKYSIEIIHNVCKLLEAGNSYGKISKLLNVNVSLPENIKRGKLWKDISSKYNIPENVSVKRSDELKLTIEELIYAGYTNREIVQVSGLPDTEHEREYVGLFRRRLFKKTI